jgi:quercetin dioxygenase-like cupin family protein
VGSTHVRGNVWRYEPRATGKRHRHPIQEETFVLLAGELSIYLGEPPERLDVPTGGVVNVPAGTPLQSENHGDVDLVVYAYGYPPEDTTAELLEPAVWHARPSGAVKLVELGDVEQIFGAAWRALHRTQIGEWADDGEHPGCELERDHVFAATIRSGSKVGSVIGHALGVSEPQGGAADLDSECDALRRRHRPVAVDRLGVVPGLAALRR